MELTIAPFFQNASPEHLRFQSFPQIVQEMWKTVPKDEKHKHEAILNWGKTKNFLLRFGLICKTRRW